MRKLKLFAVSAMILGMVACAQVTSLKDGFLGKPMNDAAIGGDIPTWYHLGEALNPVIHAILAIVRGIAGF